jgi:hypothetical protein
MERLFWVWLSRMWESWQESLIAEIPDCASALCSSDVSATPNRIIDLFPGLDIHNAAGRLTGGKPFQYCCIALWQTTGGQAAGF